MGPLLWAFALAAMLLSVSLSAVGATSAHAQQPGPIDDGGTIVFEECSIVSITVLESDALFTSVFHRYAPGGEANLGVNSLQAGETALVGEVPAGVELILGIVVDETDNTFKTGPGDRNPDGVVHAIVNGNLVEFEDKAVGEDFADWDYNDARLQISTEPCQYNLLVQVDPASTGTGSTEGTGNYPAGSDAQAKAIPGPQSAFVAWSGDCAGGSPVDTVTMDSDKVCNALFESVAPPPTPTPEPTPEPTAVPLPSTVGIDNNLVSLNPARVGETVTFRVDVALDVPAENTADVRYEFDDSELEYLSASWNDLTLDQCALTAAGVIDCAFGNVAADFSFDLNFEALVEADDSTTAASLSSDPDGAGAEAPIAAGPALADVDIIAITGSVPDTGDGSVAQSSGIVSLQLIALLGAAVLATVVGAVRFRSGTRS